jgi:hypothetical protein
MNLKYAWSFLTAVFLIPAYSEAQLLVTASPVKVEGNKAVVRLSFKNDLANVVESARATVRIANGENFLGSATKWVIGGKRNAPNLAPGATNTFFS